MASMTMSVRKSEWVENNIYQAVQVLMQKASAYELSLVQLSFNGPTELTFQLKDKANHPPLDYARFTALKAELDTLIEQNGITPLILTWN